MINLGKNQEVREGVDHCIFAGSSSLRPSRFSGILQFVHSIWEGRCLQID